jgi:hypothetical protein
VSFCRNKVQLWLTRGVSLYPIRAPGWWTAHTQARRNRNWPVGRASDWSAGESVGFPLAGIGGLPCWLIMAMHSFVLSNATGSSRFLISISRDSSTSRDGDEMIARSLREERGQEQTWHHLTRGRPLTESFIPRMFRRRKAVASLLQPRHHSTHLHASPPPLARAPVVRPMSRN